MMKQSSQRQLPSKLLQDSNNNNNKAPSPPLSSCFRKMKSPYLPSRRSRGGGRPGCDHQSSLSLTEANTSFSDDDDEEEDSEKDDSSLLPEQDDYRDIHRLIERALDIARHDLGPRHRDDDDDVDSLIDRTTDGDYSLDGYDDDDDRTVDSLVLTRRRFAKNREGAAEAAAEAKKDAIVPEVPPREESLVQDRDCRPRKEASRRTPPPPRSDDEERETPKVSSSSSSSSERLVEPTDNSPELPRGRRGPRVVPPPSGRDRDVSLEEKTPACDRLPELAWVDTDELLRYEADLEDFDDEDDDFDRDDVDDVDGYVAHEGDVVVLPPDPDWDSDYDPFDDEIDSIVVNKQRLAKNQNFPPNNDDEDDEDVPPAPRYEHMQYGGIGMRELLPSTGPYCAA